MALLALGKGTIQTTPEREAYNALRLKYQDLAEKAKQDFSDRFSVHFSNMDQLHLNCTKVAFQYLDGPIDQAIRDLITIGIMDVDDEQFRNKLLAPYSSWNVDFAEIDDKYMAIILKAEEYAKYKAARREAGGFGIVGGGFGVEGAAAGMAAATAANVAIGVVGGVLNLGADALSAMGDGVQKWSLFNDPKTKSHLAESIFRLVFQVHFAIVDAAVHHQKFVYEKVSEDDKLKAKSLFVNLSKGRIAGKVAENYLIESIALNPFEPETYLLWFNLYGDKGGRLSNVAEHFGIRDLSNHKRQILKQYKATLTLSPVEECEASLADLEKYATKIGCQDIASERADFLSLIQNLKLEQRTFNGTVYESQAVAEALKEVQDRTVDGVYYESADEANEIRAKKKNVGFLLGISIFIAPLPNALLTLQSGYSKKVGVLANIYLVIFMLLFLPKNPKLGDFVTTLIILAVFGLIVMLIRVLLDKMIVAIKASIKMNRTF